MIEQISVRIGHINDLAEIQNLFIETIIAICKKDYNDEQIRAWLSGVDNAVRWQNILKAQYVLIAEISNRIVGFITLDNNNHIDLLYTHKDFQNLGIAKKLYSQIESKVKLNNQKTITSDASITAKPFFEHMGFDEIEKQHVVRQGVDIVNYRMRKSL